MPHLVKNLPAMQETLVRSLGWEDPLEKGTAPHSSMPGEVHGQRSLVGYSPWGCSERESCSVVSDSLRPHGLYSPWNSPGQNTGVGSLPFLQGIFPIQGSNPDLLHCRWILCQLSHKGSPGILEWVAHPFSSRSSRPRNRTRVSCIAGGFFTN